MTKKRENLKAALNETGIVGMKYLKRFRKVLEPLNSVGWHHNRKLFFDDYVALLLLYHLNPAVTSLRDLQFASTLKRVQKRLGISQTSLGSLSESISNFDSKALYEIFLELLHEAQATKPTRNHFEKLPHDISVIAVDGTLLRALPRMAWAMWGAQDNEKALKAHVHFDVLRGIPTDISVSKGNGSEREALENSLKPDCLYVLDRGYLKLDLYKQILDAGSSLVARFAKQLKYSVLENFEISEEAKSQGVVLDCKAKTLSTKSKALNNTPVRVVHIETKDRNGEVHVIRILTDRFDLDPEVIGIIYQQRWQIELFFRHLKSQPGFKHLLSDRLEGLELQLLSALIAELLVFLLSNKKVNKRTLLMMNLAHQGLVEEDEILAFFNGSPKKCN